MIPAVIGFDRSRTIVPDVFVDPLPAPPALPLRSPGVTRRVSSPARRRRGKGIQKHKRAIRHSQDSVIRRVNLTGRWYELRRMVDAILNLFRTGTQWRLLPREYAPRQRLTAK